MKLIISQDTGSTEEVSTKLLDKLYNMVTDNELSNDSVLLGRLHTNYTYEEVRDTLLNAFPNQLYISALDYYIRFADPEVVRVLTDKGVIQEGGGITIAEAAVANVRFRGLFNGNTVVKNFDELRYFDKYKTTGGSGTQQIFEGATNVESVDLTGIQSTYLYYAFRRCHSLEWYHGKNGPKNVLNLEWRNISSIQSLAFEENYGLHEVTSLGIVTILDSSCFKNCINLTTIDISNITTIGASAFEGDGNLEYFSGTDSTAGELNLPNLTGTLGNSAFKGCTKLTSISSLGGITSIGNNAFENCTLLATINFPSTITSVGENAFNNTAWFNNQPVGPVYINNVLYKCKNASGALVIPNDIISITENAFNNCSSLTSVTIGSGVTSIGIGEGVFKGCTALSTITVDSNNAKYDSRNNCNAIIETDTNKLVAICNTTTIPNSITAIGNRAFSGCSRFDISALSALNLTLIEDSAFADCGCIGTFTVPLGVTLSNNAFAQIKESAGSKATIILSEGYSATVLGMFLYSRLQKVELPSTITTIAENIFYVASVNEVVIKASTPPTIKVNAFTASTITNIYVPAASVDTYKAASGWSNFASKIQAIPTT